MNMKSRLQFTHQPAELVSVWAQNVNADVDCNKNSAGVNCIEEEQFLTK